MVEGGEMNERANILARIREALQVPAPKPGGYGHAPSLTIGGRPVEQAQRWLPQGGDTFEEQVEHFRKASVELKTDFHLVNSLDEARHTLTEICATEKWQRAATHAGKLTDALCPSLKLPLLRTDRSYDMNELEQCDVGIGECDALVAQTGSIVVNSRSSGGRALSCLPPHHVVLARRDQLVRDLFAAFALVKQKFADTAPSMISVITGPSRTGDIERILVLGAHGPKKLTVICY
jgi:L-lactate dehydrogenase complex protein LldG